MRRKLALRSWSRRTVTCRSASTSSSPRVGSFCLELQVQRQTACPLLRCPAVPKTLELGTARWRPFQRWQTAPTMAITRMEEEEVWAALRAPLKSPPRRTAPRRPARRWRAMIEQVGVLFSSLFELLRPPLLCDSFFFYLLSSFLPSPIMYNSSPSSSSFSFSENSNRKLPLLFFSLFLTFLANFLMKCVIFLFLSPVRTTFFPFLLLRHIKSIST